MPKTHEAWRLHAPDDLRLDEGETPKPAPDGALVRIEAAMGLSSRHGAVKLARRPCAKPRSHGAGAMTA
jgi:hypothetical protein